MLITRNKLYLLLTVIFSIAYVWLIYNSTQTATNTVAVCIVKQTTTIPCPSCGATRAIVYLMQGKFYTALLTNPIGYLIAISMLVVPYWLLIDVFQKKDSLYIFYKKTEIFIRKPPIALLLIILVVLNWIWNIIKGL